MKIRLKLIQQAAIPVLLAIVNHQSAAFAQGTAFTYQGRLNDGANPANGTYDLRFAVYDAASSGGVVAGPLTNSVAISSGLFTVALDFGDGVFTGPNRWLDISVRTNGAAGFTPLNSRQLVTPSPYAIYGENAGTATLASSVANGAVSSAQLSTLAPPTSGQVLQFNGTSLVWTTPATGTSAWGLTGNAGTTAGLNFVGTTDNQPLELHANGFRALRLEAATNNDPNVSGAMNVIGGAGVNFAPPTAQGATIAGGGAPYYFGNGMSNRVASSFTTIGGGVNNDIETAGYESTIGGGNANSIRPNAYRSTISGGWNNIIGTNSYQSVIAGGINNNIKTNAHGSIISGGENNTVNSNAIYSAIGGGYGNTASISINFAGSGYDTIGGGYGNTASGPSGYSTVGGGYQNTASGTYATVGGGSGNGAGGNYAVVSGGFLNSASGTAAAVAGGIGNTANGAQSFAAGASAHADSTSSFVWGDGSATANDHGPNTFNVLATNGYYLGALFGQGVSGGAPVYVNSSGKLGAVNSAFIHTATSGNIVQIIGVGDATKIDNSLCNGKSGAILVAIPADHTFSGILPDSHPFSLEYRYDGSAYYWYIVSIGGSIPSGLQFNVLVANP